MDPRFNAPMAEWSTQPSQKRSFGVLVRIQVGVLAIDIVMEWFREKNFSKSFIFCENILSN